MSRYEGIHKASGALAKMKTNIKASLPSEYEMRQAELEKLQEQFRPLIGKKFVNDKNGNRRFMYLMDVDKDKVVLKREPSAKDSVRESINKFARFWKLHVE